MENGVRVGLFNLAVTDIGKVAMTLIDAAPLAVGTATVLPGPHPLAAYCTFPADALEHRTKALVVCKQAL